VVLEAHDLSPIDQDVLVVVDAAEGPAHGEVCGVIDVEPLDLGDGRRADAPRDDTLLDLTDEGFPLLRGQGLGIANAGDLVAVGPDEHRGRHHRCAERSHAHFVDSDDAQPSLLPEASLGAQVGHEGHVRDCRPDDPGRGGGRLGFPSIASLRLEGSFGRTQRRHPAVQHVRMCSL